MHRCVRVCRCPCVRDLREKPPICICMVVVASVAAVATVEGASDTDDTHHQCP